MNIVDQKNAQLNDQQRLSLQDYHEIKNRIKINRMASCTTKTTYKGDFCSVDAIPYVVEEYFKNIEEFKNCSDRRLLDKGYETENLIIYKDETVCVRSFLYIPTNDVRSEKKEISDDAVRSIAAYMSYPKIRKEFPNMLVMLLNEEIHEYQTNDQYGYFLASYQGLNYLRKEYERLVEYTKEQEQNQ